MNQYFERSSTNAPFVDIVSESLFRHRDTCTSLQPLNGELLLPRALLRPLRLLPVSTLQYHLPLLEDEPPVPKEDIDGAHACIHVHTHEYACGTMTY